MCDALPAAHHLAAKTNATKVRRRNRVINSCLECRRRKIKCLKTDAGMAMPCINCAKNARHCVFLDNASLDPAGLSKLAEIKDRVGDLESMLESEVARRAKSDTAGSPASSSAMSSASAPAPKDEHYEEDQDALPERLHEGAYDTEADDCLISDLGISMGRLAISERVGGVFRPHFNTEIETILQRQEGGMEFPLPEEEASRSVLGALVPSSSILGSGSYLASGNIPPNAPVYDGSFPTKEEADILYMQYFMHVDPLAHVLHKPSFEHQYQKFWIDVFHGFLPRESTTSLVVAVFFAAVVSMREHDVQTQFGVEKREMLDRFKLLSERTLIMAQHLRSCNLTVMQAFAINLTAEVLGTVSKAHLALVGALIRLAESAGLHSDDESFNFSPLEQHLRRLLWYQICFLDLRTTEVHASRVALRPDDFDSRMPLNVDDTHFVRSGSAPSPVRSWTSVTLTLIHFECMEIHRQLIVERRALELKSPKASTMALREKLLGRAAQVEANYLCWLDDSVPIQRYAKLMAAVLLGRIDPMLSQRYSSLETKLSGAEDLDTVKHYRALMFAGCLQVCEAGMELETDPELEPWAWYAPTFQQYHTLLFLFGEVYTTPHLPDADRIWRVITHVFGEWPGHTRQETARAIWMLLKRRLDMFMHVRRVRIPMKDKEGKRDGYEGAKPPGMPEGMEKAAGNFYLSDYQLVGQTAESINWGDWDTFFPDA